MTSNELETVQMLLIETLQEHNKKLSDELSARAKKIFELQNELDLIKIEKERIDKENTNT